VKKHLKINLKVLLLLLVYLFFHIANSFFGPRRIHDNKIDLVLKQEALSFVHLQKSAKTTISETRLSFAQLIQKASKAFILLFLFAAAIPAISYIHLTKTGLSSGPPYLRFCVIRI